MRTQLQMLAYLDENVPSHEFRTEGNKIIARSLIRGSRSFRGFTLTYLKNGEVSIKANTGKSMRYNRDQELLGEIGSMAAFTDKAHNDIYNVAS